MPYLNAYGPLSNSYPFFNAPRKELDEVLNEPVYAAPAKVFLHSSPACADMWEAARELIPVGKDKDFLIVYVPKGTGQPRMYADAFYGEYLASWIRDEQDCWKISTYTHPHQSRFRLFRKSPWLESFFTDDVFLEENATMTKTENNTVDQQLCQVCATDNANNTLLVEGVAECYYRVATRQDVEIAAGMRVMDGRNTTAKSLKEAIETH